jgi:capsular polysaccharide export protein
MTRFTPSSPSPSRGSGRRAAVFSPGIKKIPHLKEFFDFTQIAYNPANQDAHQVDVVLTWGNKETGQAARRYAARHRKPVWSVEDGFFRSLNPGARNPQLSLVLDDVGIYYDARQASLLENLILAVDGNPQEPDLIVQAKQILTLIRHHGLSKYNNGRARVDLPTTRAERILVVDQTEGDASIEGGLADGARFSQMMEWALSHHPRAEILVKTHPEVLSGQKKGCIDARFFRAKNVHRLTTNYGPHELLQCVDHVATVSSQLGFDALCSNKSVTCFGAPFYAGWALTEDRITVPRRGHARTLEQLAAAALLLYPTYVDPVSGTRCSPIHALRHLGLQRDMARSNEGITFALGFSAWKRPYVKPFLDGPHAEVTFLDESELAARLQKEKPTRVVAWGQRISTQAAQLLATHSTPLIRMEDGFLRSTALGSDLTPPLSVVLDERGIYYDPRQPSRLEELLRDHPFSDEERTLGKDLMAAITGERLSKYNVQEDTPLPMPSAVGQPIHLVIGQVDDDASVLLGTQSVRSSEDLVREVRRRHPHCYLIYKPHPDVVAKNRLGVLTSEAEHLIDWIETSRSIAACLDAANHVHTMTSFAGFEALLRRLPVTTYGLPFYAGWGLTQDTLSCERRSRPLSIEELVYATLVLYPRYYSEDAHCFITAQQASQDLVRSLRTNGRGDVDPSLSRKARRLFRYLRGFFHGA